MLNGITVPYYESLERPTGWLRAPDNDKAFHIIRLHYHLRGRDAGLVRGPAISDLSVSDGVTREVSETIRFTMTWVDVEQAIRSVLTENAGARAFVSHLGSILDGGFGNITGASALELRKSWLERISNISTTTNLTTVSKEYEKTIKYTVTPNTECYLVSCYRRLEYDVYLTFVDHLFLEYKREGLKLIPRRIKSPPWPPSEQRKVQHNWHLAPNVSPRLNWPIKTLELFEPTPLDSPVVGKGYKPGVERPHEITQRDLVTEIGYPIKPTEQYSLYKLANEAFPLKYTKYLDVTPTIN